MRVVTFLLVSLCLTGCSYREMATAWYGVEAGGYYAYDRYKKSNDVVLVKGIKGNPNRLYMRRGWNKLWGPSPELKNTGLGFWQYLEKNRRIQIYESVEAAVYGKHKFIMSPRAHKVWLQVRKKMGEKYPTQVDYAMYEHLLERKAQINEAVSELKQESVHFKHRHSKKKDPPIKLGPHDKMTMQQLLDIGFCVVER